MPILKELPQEEIDKIIEAYKNNISLREIGRRFSVNRAAVSKMLEELGIKTTKGNHYRKYFFDFDYFEKIDTPNKAYWLGFMYADGCIHKKPKYGQQYFSLTQKIEDEEILLSFKKDLKSTYPIIYDNSKGRNGHVQAIIKGVSQKTVDDLKKLGCVEHKSLKLIFPSEEQIPKELIYHFIRGYFDGDGSISFNGKAANISFVGTESFIKTLSTYFKGGGVYLDKRRTNSWYFNLGGNLQVIEAYHLMYFNADRFMKRKYEKFQSLLKKYNES